MQQTVCFFTKYWGKILVKKFLFQYSVLILFCVVGIFFGVIMLYLGIDQVKEIQNRPENYEITSGVLFDYAKLKDTANGVKYQLSYVYEAGGTEYRMSCVMIQKEPPHLNSQAQILYDVTDPQSAQLVYKENYPMLILAGVLLIVLPVVLLMGALISFGLIDFKHINLLEVSMGLGFLCFGLLFTYAICGTFSPIQAF